tara:strand:+ start:3450 stop:3833 length:384 start_codon:yes stop_codon:yes gene_type:complete
VSHHASIRIRYGEVDPQGVVFNAHYLAYIDDVFDTWLRELTPRFEDLGWEVMLKAASLEWHGPAGVGDVLDVTAEVVRWGTTSLDVEFDLRVGDRQVVTATVTYVGVTIGDHRPISPPDEVRAHLDA